MMRIIDGPNHFDVGSILKVLYKLLYKIII